MRSDILFQEIGIRNGCVVEASMARPRRKSGQVHPSGTSGFAVLRYWVSNLRGIAVLRKKICSIAVLSFYSAVCGIVIY